jgi:hypothetical protein
MKTYQRNSSYKLLHTLLYGRLTLGTIVKNSSILSEDEGIVRVDVRITQVARHLRMTRKRLEDSLSYLVEIGLVSEFHRGPLTVTLDVKLPK